MAGEVLKTDAPSGPPASLSPPRPHPPERRSWWRGCRASSRGPIAYGRHRAARWAGPRGGPGRGGGPRSMELPHELVRPPPPRPRSPATTAPSSRAAWSRCCCWDRAGRRVPGAVPAREPQGRRDREGGAGTRSPLGWGPPFPARRAPRAASGLQRRPRGRESPPSLETAVGAALDRKPVADLEWSQPWGGQRDSGAPPAAAAAPGLGCLSPEREG